MHPIVVMIVMIFIVALVFSGILMILTAATNNLITGFPKYQHRLMALINDIMNILERLTDRLDIALGNVPSIDTAQLLSPGGFSVTKVFSNVMTTTMGIGWNFFLVIVFFLFIVAQGGQMHRRLKNVMSDTDHKKTAISIKNIQVQIQRYLLTKTIISLCTAIVGMVLMLLYGVDFVLVCGILLFVLNFIPNVGSIIASFIPMLICLLQSGFDLRTVFFSLLIIATQMLFGNIIEPKVHGDRMNISPIIVLVSLIFWGWVWGIVGMILAVPFTSAINIILKQLDEKNFISAIISGE
jgi:predicted PurR-regulated permease PerM